jgi:hypothetical protein
LSDDRAIWEIRVGIYATVEQAEDLKNRVQLVLCPEPEHSSPCPIPWTTWLVDAETLAEDGVDHSGLVEQYTIENR